MVSPRYKGAQNCNAWLGSHFPATICHSEQRPSALAISFPLCHSKHMVELTFEIQLFKPSTESVSGKPNFVWETSFVFKIQKSISKRKFLRKYIVQYRYLEH